MSSSMLSPLDDLPIHQTALPVRQPATSDRNFYDRYYFNCHPCSDELFLVLGMGQYPNLGVQDAFALVRRGAEHRVVRASRELGLDRLDTSVGPFRVEVIEGLKTLRCTLEAAEHGMAYDLTWTGYVPAFQEPARSPAWNSTHCLRWRVSIPSGSNRCGPAGSSFSRQPRGVRRLDARSVQSTGS